MLSARGTTRIPASARGRASIKGTKTQPPPIMAAEFFEEHQAAMDESQLGADLNEGENSENIHLKKRLVQMQYLEQENQNLALENEDLNQTVKINKDIIRSLLQGDSCFDDKFEFYVAQVEQENELWEVRVRTLTDQRDRLQAEALMQQQIMQNVVEKDDDVAEIYKDEIDELKENLERKEYLLQLAEQRVAAYEKLLINLGARDHEVQAKLNEQRIVLKERKITNVVEENATLKKANANLLD